MTNNITDSLKSKEGVYFTGTLVIVYLLDNSDSVVQGMHDAIRLIL